MASPIENHTMQKNADISKGIFLRFLQIAIGFLLQFLVLFLAAGRFTWVWAWIYLGIFVLSVTINSTFLLRTHPDTVAERGRPPSMLLWDKVISGLWSLAQFLAIPLIAGLDARSGWTGEIGVIWHYAGAALFAGGLSLFGWGMITNAYFSTVVRIQSERGQTVCRSGPYQWLRHPGYTGTILQSIGMPILLGSLWALIPGVIAAGLMIVRTVLEDRKLQADLPGYQEYAKQVRYRLLPWIW
jgi:protein-S-isoprenylcysteine O-methyltransferase Ste14